MAFSLLASSATFAGYNETDWGMTREQVQKLYPGGIPRVYDSKTGRTSYEIETQIVGYSAHVQFVFVPEERAAGPLPEGAL